MKEALPASDREVIVLADRFAPITRMHLAAVRAIHSTTNGWVVLAPIGSSDIPLGARLKATMNAIRGIPAVSISGLYVGGCDNTLTNLADVIDRQYPFGRRPVRLAVWSAGLTRPDVVGIMQRLKVVVLQPEGEPPVAVSEGHTLVRYPSALGPAEFQAASVAGNTTLCGTILPESIQDLLPCLLPPYEPIEKPALPAPLPTLPAPAEVTA